MTQVLSPNDVGIKDFTEHIDVKFRIDDDLFVGVPNIPGKQLIAFNVQFQSISVEALTQTPEAFDSMIRMILTDASAELFIARMDDKKRPISMVQVMKIFPWLLEQYGMVPTEPSEDSSDGSVNLAVGTSSTENRSVTESIPFNFPQSVS